MLVPLLVLASAGLSPPPAAERSPEAAVRVILQLYEALDRRDYARAFALWKGGRSFAAYRAGYLHTVAARVTPLAPVTVEGGMGHSWANVRVRVHARLDDGRRQHFVGSYTLRRVNDVDGSPPSQRRWHIVAAKLMPADR